jgi:hypothetical protein
MWRSVHQPRSRPRVRTAQMLGVLRHGTSDSSLPQLYKCLRPLHRTPQTSVETNNIPVLNYSWPSVFLFTQETAEPLRFSPAEPVD